MSGIGGIWEPDKRFTCCFGGSSEVLIQKPQCGSLISSICVAGGLKAFWKGDNLYGSFSENVLSHNCTTVSFTILSSSCTTSSSYSVNCLRSWYGWEQRMSWLIAIRFDDYDRSELSQAIGEFRYFWFCSLMRQSGSSMFFLEALPRPNP